MVKNMAGHPSWMSSKNSCFAGFIMIVFGNIMIVSLAIYRQYELCMLVKPLAFC